MLRSHQCGHLLKRLTLLFIEYPESHYEGVIPKAIGLHSCPGPKPDLQLDHQVPTNLQSSPTYIVSEQLHLPSLIPVCQLNVTSIPAIQAPGCLPEFNCSISTLPSGHQPKESCFALACLTFLRVVYLRSPAPSLCISVSCVRIVHLGPSSVATLPRC